MSILKARFKRFCSSTGARSIESSESVAFQLVLAYPGSSLDTLCMVEVCSVLAAF